MKLRAFLPLLGLVVAVLTPLAYASPPDPVWVTGFFDDGDHDDVVVLLTSSSAVVEPFPLDGATFPLDPGSSVLQGNEEPAPTCPTGAADARGPPLA